jgi:hypothetical protein
MAVLMFRGLIFKCGADKLAMPRIGFTIMKTVLTLRSILKKRKISNIKTKCDCLFANHDMDSIVEKI